MCNHSNHMFSSITYLLLLGGPDPRQALPSFLLRSRSPVLCILDQGCSIVRYETQGTEVLPELSALAGEVGRPRGAVEGARGHRRSSPGATCRGPEGLRDLVQAAVF